MPAILFKYKTPKWQSGIAMPMAAIARSVFPMLTVHGEHAIGVGSHRAKSEKNDQKLDFLTWRALIRA